MKAIEEYQADRSASAASSRRRIIGKLVLGAALLLTGLLARAQPCAITNESAAFAFNVATREASGVMLLWDSCSDHLYASGPFSLLQGNIPGQAGTTSVTDTNPANGNPILYRVAVPE